MSNKSVITRHIEYFRDNPKGYWFKRNLYGWGWVPVRWQGWAVILVYIASVAKVFMYIDAASHSASDTLIGVFIPFLVLTAILIAVCYKTGESPRWQWGLPNTKKTK